MKNKKVLLFPGCFDPFHIQHKNIVETISKDSYYDELWILINEDSNEKKIIVNFLHRLKMVEINIQNQEKIKIIKKPIGFYTTEIVKKIKKENPNIDFYLILGMDQINKLLEWKKSDKLNDLIKIIAISRETYNFDSKIKEKYDIKIFKNFNINNFNSSSIKIGESWNFLTENTKKYIIKNNLYFKNILKNNMSKKRMEHSIEVAKLSKKIINFYGFKSLEEKAYISGFFHDLTKEWSEQKHLEFCKKFKINDVFLQKIPFPIWHSKTSYLFLKHNLIIEDKEILQAIEFHTTAKENMNILEQVLYIADKLEFSKTGLKFEDLKKILETKKLEDMFKSILFKQIKKIKDKNSKITIDGQNAFNFYSNLI